MLSISVSDKAGKGVIIALLFSSNNFTAKGSPLAIIAGLLCIQSRSHWRSNLSATPLSAGPTAFASNLWHAAQLALNNASPAATSPPGAASSWEYMVVEKVSENTNRRSGNFERRCIKFTFFILMDKLQSIVWNRISYGQM